MAATVNLRIEQGTTWGIAFPVLDDEGEPVDLTGWTARAQIRPRESSSTVLFEWSSTGTADGLIDISEDRVSLIVEASQSSAWEFNQGVYDIELTTADGDRWRPVSGTVYVSPEVTR